MPAPTVSTAEFKRHPLPDTPNFRDLGGYRLSDGSGRLRPGHIYRSPRLSHLSDRDVAALERLAPLVLIDFRGRKEAEVAPCAVPSRLVADRYHLPIEPKSGGGLRAIVDSGRHSAPDVAEDVLAAMIRSYRNYVIEHANVHRAFFKILDDAGDKAIVFHCTAGKDRTGYAAALLLTLLGCDTETIVEDYLATNTLWAPAADQQARWPEDLRPHLFKADRRYLEAALQAIADQHGDHETYYAHIGLNPERRDRLRARLVEPLAR